MKFKDQIVSVPNALIDAKWVLATNPHKIMLLILCQLKPINYLRGLAPEIVITAKDWQEFRNSEQPYRDLQRSVKDLKEFEPEFPNGRVKMFETIEYKKKEGKIISKISKDFLYVCVKFSKQVNSELNRTSAKHKNRLGETFQV